MHEVLVLNCLKRVPLLETPRLILRKVKKSDAQDMYEYFSDADVSRYLTWDIHESLKYTKKYLKYLVGQYKTGEYLDWAIVLKDSGKVIGTVGYTALGLQHAKCEIGYVLNKNYWGMGFATEAVCKVLDYSFNEIEFNRVEARVIEGNTASASVLEKCGLLYEGTFKDEVFVKGKFYNVKHYAALKNSWTRR